MSGNYARLFLFRLNKNNKWLKIKDLPNIIFSKSSSCASGRNRTCVSPLKGREHNRFATDALVGPVGFEPTQPMASVLQTDLSLPR